VEVITYDQLVESAERALTFEADSKPLDQIFQRLDPGLPVGENPAADVTDA
jgi:hypothetical protein